MSHEGTSIDKNQLLKMVVRRGVVVFVLSLILLFVPARTFNYWEAWIYICLLYIPASSFMIYLYKNDPEFLKKRIKIKEKEREQKILVRISSLFFFGAFLIPGLDKYYGWSSVPFWLKIFSDAAVLLGYLICVVVFLQNRFASRIIEVQEKQKVIDTGLYSIVRHPMYDGVLILYGFTPLALGSFWMLIGSLYLVFIIIFRIFNEEKLLEKELTGYKEYMQKVKYRLIPGIW